MSRTPDDRAVRAAVARIMQRWTPPPPEVRDRLAQILGADQHPYADEPNPQQDKEIHSPGGDS